MGENEIIKTCMTIIDVAGFAAPSNVRLDLPTRVQMVVDRLNAEIAMTNQISSNSDKLQETLRKMEKEMEILKTKNAALTAETIRLSKSRKAGWGQ